MATSIILDCDPGHDDAVAMLLAWGSPDIDLIGVTTVFGNQTVEKVTRNALSVAAIAGITGVPFAMGADRPLVREVETAGTIHGESGLDGPALPDAAFDLDGRHAVQFLIDEIMSRPEGTVTLVPTAALTNIALAARLEPRIVPRVKEVVLMGGGYGGGNWTAAAEFNILIDPEAAHVVFGAGWPVTMVGLDVTHQALATPAVVEGIASIGTPVSRFVEELMEFFGETYKDQQGFDSPPVHDPVAVAYVIDPSVLTVRRAPVSIELTGTHTLGMTLADLRAPAPEGTTTSIATAIDAPRFWELVTDAIRRLG